MRLPPSFYRFRHTCDIDMTHGLSVTFGCGPLPVHSCAYVWRSLWESLVELLSRRASVGQISRCNWHLGMCSKINQQACRQFLHPLWPLYWTDLSNSRKQASPIASRCVSIRAKGWRRQNALNLSSHIMAHLLMALTERMKGRSQPTQVRNLLSRPCRPSHPLFFRFLLTQG